MQLADLNSMDGNIAHVDSAFGVTGYKTIKTTVSLYIY